MAACRVWRATPTGFSVLPTSRAPCQGSALDGLGIGQQGETTTHGRGTFQEAELDEEISPTAARAGPGSQPRMTRERGEFGHCQAGGCPQGPRRHRAIKVAPPLPHPVSFPGPSLCTHSDHWFCLLFPVPLWSWEYLASAPCWVEQDSSQPAAWALTTGCAFLSPPAEIGRAHV